MIKESAILQDGIIYTGRRHDLILNAAVPFGALKSGEQGFVTDDGRFVTRSEAAQIALACRQIEKLKYSETDLYSEDLY